MDVISHLLPLGLIIGLDKCLASTIPRDKMHRPVFKQRIRRISQTGLGELWDTRKVCIRYGKANHIIKLVVNNRTKTDIEVLEMRCPEPSRRGKWL